jgi:protein gp37
MGEKTGIPYAHHTWSAWWGCTMGCRFCYAHRLAHRYGSGSAYNGGPFRAMSEAHWREPLRWNRAAAKAVERRRVLPSMCDWLDPGADADTQSRWARLIEATPNLDWLMLTKRSERLRLLWPGWTVPPNVWLGVSATNQAEADRRIADLLATPAGPATVRFVSLEPLKGPVDLCLTGLGKWPGHLDWVVIGAESGCRPPPVSFAAEEERWMRAIVNQCVAASVPVFVKQAWLEDDNDRMRLIEMPEHLGGKSWDQMPEPPHA